MFWYGRDELAAVYIFVIGDPVEKRPNSHHKQWINIRTKRTFKAGGAEDNNWALNLLVIKSNSITERWMFPVFLSTRKLLQQLSKLLACTERLCNRLWLQVSLSIRSNHWKIGVGLLQVFIFLASLVAFMYK